MVWILFITRLQGVCDKNWDIFVTMARNIWSFISIWFMQFPNKFNLKNTTWCIKIHKQCTGKSKIGPFQHGVWSKFLWKFWINFLNLLTILNILFIKYNSRRRKWGGFPLTHKYILNYSAEFHSHFPQFYLRYRNILSLTKMRWIDSEI